MTTTFQPPRLGDVPRPGRPPTGLVLGSSGQRSVLIARADCRTEGEHGHVASARMIARAASTVDHSTMAALGMAIHLVAEPAAFRIDAEHHQVVAIATSQIRAVLAGDDPLPSIEALVTDPHRRAAGDGRAAAEYFGDEWPSIRDTAGDRAAEACIGAESFGTDAVIKLAVVRGVNCTRAWWGTPAWDDAVASWAAGSERSAELLARLRNAPDRVPVDVVADILGALAHR